jgi:hypothetical protein
LPPWVSACGVADRSPQRKSVRAEFVIFRQLFRQCPDPRSSGPDSQMLCFIFPNATRRGARGSPNQQEDDPMDGNGCNECYSQIHALLSKEIWQALENLTSGSNENGRSEDVRSAPRDGRTRRRRGTMLKTCGHCHGATTTEHVSTESLHSYRPANETVPRPRVGQSAFAPSSASRISIRAGPSPDTDRIRCPCRLCRCPARVRNCRVLPFVPSFV